MKNEVIHGIKRFSWRSERAMYCVFSGETLGGMLMNISSIFEETCF